MTMLSRLLGILGGLAHDVREGGTPILVAFVKRRGSFGGALESFSSSLLGPVGELSQRHLISVFSLSIVTSCGQYKVAWSETSVTDSTLPKLCLQNWVKPERVIANKSCSFLFESNETVSLSCKCRRKIM